MKHSNMKSSLRAGCSPLRPHRQKSSISSGASAHLRHLHQVAAWASLHVPPLGAFLGSRLAATSEILGCPPPSSPHLTCQRCESILHVGINCSARIRTRKLKQRCTVPKGVSAPINCIIYLCQHCAFESVMPGTSKAYVKTKLSEAAACRKVSEPYQSLDVCMAEKVTQPVKVSRNEILASATYSTESPGSNSKRTKRKGWLSLKELSVSSVDLSPVDRRPAFSGRSTKLPLLSQLRRLGSTNVMPTVSRMDIKCLVPTSGIVEDLCTKTTREQKAYEVDMDFDKVVTGKVRDIRSDEVVTGKFGDIRSDEAVTVRVSYADSSKLAAFKSQMGQSNGATSLLCVPQLEGSDSLGLVSTRLRSDAEVKKPISSTKGEGSRTNEDVTCNLSSVDSVVDANLPLMVRNSIGHVDCNKSSFPSNKKGVISNNSSIAKSVQSKKRKCGDDNNWSIVPRKQESCKPEANKLRLDGLDIKKASSMMLVGQSDLICIKDKGNTQASAHERSVKPRTKKKPLFKRVGRQWFTICMSSRTLKWRII